MNDKPKVLVVVGPTSSGKTSLSIDLAKKFNGEVISADSRQVYRGMDLGTGKVTQEEKQGVTHYMLDVADPKDTYTVADFVSDGKKCLNQIIEKGKLPIIAGGTFFYIDALLEKISLPEVPPNQKLRDELEAQSTEELFAKLSLQDADRASTIDPQNRRRLIRALELIDTLGQVPKNHSTSPYDVLTIGINIDIDQLRQAIKVRLLERLEEGMVREVENLVALGVTHERLEELGLEYRYISRYLRGLLKYDEMVEELNTKIGQYAKRQLTWLKRDQTIKWFAKDDPNIFTLVEEFVKTK